MATDTKKKKGFERRRKVKMIRQTEMEKRKLVCVGNLMSQILHSRRFRKTEPKFLVHLNRTDFENQKEITSMKRCLSG
jgi:hypothetical protein